MKRIVTRNILHARRMSSHTSSSGPCTKYLKPTCMIPSSSPSQTTTDTLGRALKYLLPVYARPDFVLTHGKGSWVTDAEGRRFLDFSAGIAVNALGHADEGVAQVIGTQAGKLLHTSNAFHHEWAGRLAELLVTLTEREGGLGYPGGGETSGLPGAKVFFSNTGTEANEGALKIARKVGKDRWAAAGKNRDVASGECTKTRIACFSHAFHGRTFGALSVTQTKKYQAPFEPLLPGIDVGQLNVESELSTLVTEDTCAVIVEPIQGEGGIYAADESFLRALRRRCDEVGAVLIFDEIQCGLYRTGKLWAHSTLPVDCHPDIVTMAKPLGNGYPIGAVLMRDNIAATMTVGIHGTTFGGSPLGCAVGCHVLGRLSAPEMTEHIRTVGAHLGARLERLPELFPETVSDVRGRGLIRGIGFRRNGVPGEIVGLARERGVIVLSAGTDAVRLVPSLTVSESEVDLAVDVLESCIAVSR